MRYFTWKLELVLFRYFMSYCCFCVFFDLYRPELFIENACFIRWHLMLSLVFVILIHIILHIIRSYTGLKVIFVLSYCVKSVQIRSLSGLYLPASSLNAIKHGVKKVLIWTLFTQFWLSRVLKSILLDWLNYINKSFFYQMKWIREFV